MKTILDKTTRDELITRINTLDESSNAQWGKMNIYQMLKHNTIWNEWMLGTNKPKYKQEFIGRIFGKMMLKRVTKNDKPLGRNAPAGAGFKVKEKSGGVESEKKQWITLIEEYEHYSNPDFIHDFFGRMTKEQVGLFAYKHTDHHLRQFNS